MENATSLQHQLRLNYQSSVHCTEKHPQKIKENGRKCKLQLEEIHTTKHTWCFKEKCKDLRYSLLSSQKAAQTSCGKRTLSKEINSPLRKEKITMQFGILSLILDSCLQETFFLYAVGNLPHQLAPASLLNLGCRFRTSGQPQGYTTRDDIKYMSCN